MNTEDDNLVDLNDVPFRMTAEEASQRASNFDASVISSTVREELDAIHKQIFNLSAAGKREMTVILDLPKLTTLQAVMARTDMANQIAEAGFSISVQGHDMKIGWGV